jgi:hypothetical protein
MQTTSDTSVCAIPRVLRTFFVYSRKFRCSVDIDQFSLKRVDTQQSFLCAWPMLSATQSIQVFANTVILAKGMRFA